VFCTARALSMRGTSRRMTLRELCLYALAAASRLPSKAAVRRLVTVTLAGCAPAPDPTHSGAAAPGGPQLSLGCVGRLVLLGARRERSLGSDRAPG
jgi:hypothetical protein